MELSDLFDCESLESVDRKIDFERMLDCLSARDKRIVALYACGLTYDEIGEKVGLTKGRIRQILGGICKR